MKNPVTMLFGSLGLLNRIIIEADRGTKENTQAVFQEMLSRGWDSKYRFVLVTEEPKALLKWKSNRISIYRRPTYHGRKWSHLRLLWPKYHAAMIIDENLQIRKKLPETVHVLLTHGSPVKSVHSYYRCSPDTDYMLNQSPFWEQINSYELDIPQDRLVTFGFPRNDSLYSSNVRLEELFGKAYQKVIVWYPTFRQRKGKDRHSNIPIPVLHSEEAARKINAYASKYNILLLIKPHPAQDLSRIVALDLDHLKFIYDDFFIEHGITAHEFLAKTDALITDYSSIVFDYLLTEKPIALTWEDYDEYKEKVGFAIDMDILRSCSTMLNSIDDFDGFFRDIVEGNDPLRTKREEVMHLTNQFTDGNSTKRVVDWLETLLK